MRKLTMHRNRSRHDIVSEKAGSNATATNAIVQHSMPMPANDDEERTNEERGKKAKRVNKTRAKESKRREKNAKLDSRSGKGSKKRKGEIHCCEGTRIEATRTYLDK